MSNTNDGGLAFPALDSTGTGGGLCLREPGMTLRAYYAAKAMQALLSTEAGLKLTHADRAEFACNQADAMIAAGAV